MREKTKKILILNYEFPPVGGGGGVAAFKLAKGFVNLGHQVDVITSGYLDLKSFEIIEGVNTYRVKTVGRKDKNSATMTSMFSYLIFGFFKGVKLCKKNQYDFINTHFAVPTGPLGYLLGRLFNNQNVLSIHGGDIYDPSKKISPHKSKIFNPIVKFILNKADFIVAQSNNTKDNALNYYNKQLNIKIIPLAYEELDFDIVDRSQLNLSKNKQYLIGVGRLVKRKGFEYLIRSLKYLDANIHLLIVGDGPERTPLEAEAKDLELANRVTFLGNISEKEKFQYLQDSDLYVLSSLHEGFGIVIQEAMQVGLPVVSTNHGGQVDLIKNGENGYLVPPKDPSALAKKIKIILSNKPLRQQFSAYNKNLIIKFNINTIAQEYIDLTKII